MRSTRTLVGRLLVDGDLVSLGYADAFGVVREGDRSPGERPGDHGPHAVRASSRAGLHVLELDALHGSRLLGRALLRFSHGHRHVFHSDGDLVVYRGS